MHNRAESPGYLNSHARRILIFHIEISAFRHHPPLMGTSTTISVKLTTASHGTWAVVSVSLRLVDSFQILEVYF